MKQKLDRERLTQAQAAQLMSCDERTLRRWEKHHQEHGLFPRNADGTYHLAALIWWRIANKIGLDGVQQSNARARRR